ncbi:hypothetical protein, partial [Sulfurimonas sp.]|uniref:hypothetical protein n=1 Tax=Sulfurimonas sp. TaxID=2022749 RepID=UPI003563907B
QIIRTTVGKGTITTTSDISNLNRDTTKIQQITKDESSNLELYASDNSFNAMMDPVKAKDELKQNIKDMGLNAHKEILENIPSGKNSASNTGNKVEDAINDVVNSTIGELLDAVSTAGVLPSQENGGGYITQIATQLFGDNRNVLVVKDRQTLVEAGIGLEDIQKITLVKTKSGIKKISEVEDATGLERVVVWTTNPNKAVRIDEQPIANDSLKDYKIHVSSNDIKNAGLDHIFTNGMFNNSDTAIYNQQTQQGYADGLLNYNQQHGILGDIIEDAQDHITSNTGMSFLGTGGSRQTGEAIKQMTVRTKGNLVVGAHSQGTMMSQNGLAQNKEEIAKIVQNNPNSKFLVGYAGSPVNHNVAENTVMDIYGGKQGILQRFGENAKISDVFRSHVAPQDTVGSFLGLQSAGINNSEELGSNVWSSFISTPMLFGVGGDSSHSYYPCVIGCGDGEFTPKIENYYNPNTNKEIPLVEYYKTLNVDTTLYTGEKK